MRWMLLLLAVVGCGCSETLPLRGDETFSPDERAAIEHGNAWLAEQIGQDPFAIVWDLPHPATPTDAGPCSIVRGVTDPMNLGYASATGDHVELFVRDHTLLAAVAAHEFGHLHGLQHHLGPGVMAAHTDLASLVWTDADREQCLRAGVCR